MAPTFSSGNALDRMLLLPGEEIWSAVMPSSIQLAGEGENAQIPEDSFFSSTVLPPIKMSAHRPVYLDLPFVDEPRQPRTRVLDTQSITQEQWLEYKRHVQMALKEESSPHLKDIHRGDVH